MVRGMTRMNAGAGTIIGAVAALSALALTSCSAGTEATASSAEVQEWMTAQENPAGGALASMVGLAQQASDLADETLDDLSDQIRIDFQEPTRVAEVEFTCFGAETMDVSLFTQAGSSQIGTGAVDVRCDDGPISLETGVGDAHVDRMSVIGGNSSGAGAWAVTIR